MSECPVIQTSKEIAKDTFNVRKWTLEQWGWGACLVMVVATFVKVAFFP